MEKNNRTSLVEDVMRKCGSKNILVDSSGNVTLKDDEMLDGAVLPTVSELILVTRFLQQEPVDPEISDCVLNNVTKGDVENLKEYLVDQQDIKQTDIPDLDRRMGMKRAPLVANELFTVKLGSENVAKVLISADRCITMAKRLLDSSVASENFEKIVGLRI